MALRVWATRTLKSTLESQGADLEVFQLAFANWRHNWPQNEYTNPYFGKDGAYVAPAVGGQGRVLRHVHIIPIKGAQQSVWRRMFDKGRRRTSDRHLVYVESKLYGFLLIDILEEPYAHDIAKMATREDRLVMETFAKIAEEFRTDGSIVA